ALAWEERLVHEDLEHPRPGCVDGRRQHNEGKRQPDEPAVGAGVGPEALEDFPRGKRRGGLDNVGPPRVSGPVWRLPASQALQQWKREATNEGRAGTGDTGAATAAGLSG